MASLEVLLTTPTASSSIALLHERRLSLNLKSPSSRRSSLSPVKDKQRTFSPTRLLGKALYHAQTVNLFTYSDLKNIIFPQALLALVLTSANTPATTLLTRFPQTLAWLYLHLLFFNLSNQTKPNSLAEDKANKPWRPISSGRITLTSARQLRYVVMMLCILISGLLGVTLESVALITLMILYNDCGGDQHAAHRAWLNSAGYASFALGGVAILSEGQGVSGDLWGWMGILSAAITVTGYLQDFEDLDGDRATGRKTVPVLIGEEWALLGVAVAMAGFTSLAGWYWKEGRIAGWLIVVAICASVLKKLVKTREVQGWGKVKGYKSAYRLWSLWLVGLYILPLFSR